MINRIYRLFDSKRIEMVQREVNLDTENILIKPEYMSICAADNRYFFGKRKKEILNKKLPMALIHEAIGTILYDPNKEFLPGQKVVIIPNIPSLHTNDIKGNYQKDSVFMSSGIDGFMQDILSIRRDRVILLPDDYSEIYVLSELVSVSINAIDAFEKACNTKKEFLGIWGDGSVGFITGIVLKTLYPKAKIYSFGKNMRKIQLFSYSDKTFIINDIPKDIQLDHCFECVGGVGSEIAINQMIDMINPQGCISLLGVSEEPVSINTRVILEKGINIIGNSRSERCDFEKAIDLIHNNSFFVEYLKSIISQIIEINNESDISYAFEQDISNDFKTIIRWNI